MENVLAICLVLLFHISGMGQSTGIPFVESYPKELYGYGTQNWDIEQGGKDFLYFANNEGLMEFDGAEWRLYPLPNKTILRSILIRDGSIYAGGQNEFGVYQPDIHQKWRFHSLKDSIPPEHRDFEDVWNMEWLGDRLYFRASEKIFVFSDQSCRVLDSIPVNFFGKAGQRLFAQDREGRLFLLTDQSFTQLPGSEKLLGTEVRKVVETDDRFLIATFRNGIYTYDGQAIEKWSPPGEKYFKDPFINTIDLLDNGDIVLGTGFTGLFILTPSGALKYHLNTDNGLSNDRVICTFVDRRRNLWLGQDNGVSLIQTNSPFTRIYPQGELAGAGYDVAIFKDNIYFGVSSGLLYAPWNSLAGSSNLQIVQNTNGQVWSIDILDDRLIVNHDEGAFLVSGARATRFFTETGAWLFQPDELHEDLVLSGNYEGISIFDRATLQRLYDIPALEESSRFIVQDATHHYWMAHPYRGLYRISYPHDPERRKVERLGPDSGLPSNLHNHVFKINGEVLVCAEKGVYIFDPQQQRFTPYEPINRYLGAETKVRRLFEAPSGDIWFVTQREVGVLEVEEKGLARNITKRVFPELKPLMNGGWEKIYPFDDDHVFITTIHGFIHYDGRLRDTISPAFDIVVNKMSINKDSVIFPSAVKEDYHFSHRQRSLLFQVAATEYVNNPEVEFRYFLEDFDDNWSDWSPLRDKEYTNLPPGEYTLRIQGRNTRGELSPVYTLRFTIDKPRYTTFPALIVYIALLTLGGYLLHYRSRKKYRALEKRADSMVQKSKEEIQRLETEKIQAELDHKKRELVSATLHVVQKNETLAGIVEQLTEIRQSSNEEKVRKQLRKLIRSLKNDEVLDEGWDQVMYHFSELHEDFFERLKKAYPSLTPKDLKLCAYLKMNLTTKEMASLMNVSVRGVEASRYRLRKKLELPTEVNLTEFMMGF